MSNEKKKKKKKSNGLHNPLHNIQTMSSVVDSDVLSRYQGAAEIVNRIMHKAKGECQAGRNISELCAACDTWLEDELQKVWRASNSKGIALPASISVNECACHMSPSMGGGAVQMPEAQLLLQHGDLVKL